MAHTLSCATSLLFFKIEHRQKKLFNFPVFFIFHRMNCWNIVYYTQICIINTTTLIDLFVPDKKFKTQLERKPVYLTNV